MRLDNGCPEIGVLRLLINGELPSTEAEALALHIECCPRCIQILDKLPTDGPLTEILQAQSQVCLAPPSQAMDGLIDRVGKLVSTPEPIPVPRRGDVGFLAAPLLPDEIGRLAHYRVLRLLGEGGMGMVFLAEDPSLNRHVALKVLHPEVARHPASRLRFLHEARATAALHHDNIVVIHQVGEDCGVPFLAMELLEGENLRDWLRRHRQPPLSRVLEVGRAVARGLAAAHARGLIHCDIKPANLWLEKPADNDANRSAAELEVGRVKLLDFGIVRTVGADSTGAGLGFVLGTPDYMAPECLRGAALDGRCDLYSLGCVLYEMCCGRTPFGGGTKEEVLTRVLHDPPPSVRDDNPSLPPALTDLIHKLLAKAPQDRPASASDVERTLADLNRALRSDSPAATAEVVTTALLPTTRSTDRLPSRARKAAVGALAAALLLGIVTWLMRGSAPAPREIASPPPGPVGDAWLEYVRGLTAEQQAAAVLAKLDELNSGFSGKVEYFHVDNGVVDELRFRTDGVVDVTPLRALPNLRRLDCRGSLPGKGRLADLTPLIGMSLEALWCDNNPIADLSPLHGMPLAELHASHTAVTELTELHGMSLGLLTISRTKVRDLEPLRGMPSLVVLHCQGCPIRDFSPLQQTPLRVLHADLDPREDRGLLVNVRSLEDINHRRPSDFWRLP